MWKGLLWVLYIVSIYTDTHGFRIGICLGGLGAGSAPGSSFGGSYPCRRAWGLGWGVLICGEKDNPSLGTVPFWRKFWKGHLVPGPSLSIPCPQSGVVGEVADRFPGQHRGRLGWSSGQQGRGQVSPGTPPTHSLGSPPSRHCTLWSRGSPDLSHFHTLKPGRPGSLCALCSGRLGQSSGSLTG